MTAPLGRIRQTALNPAQLARKVIRNPRLFHEVAEGLKTDKPRVKYGCAKTLRLISEQRPDLLYPHFDFFAGLLDHENKILQWDAAFVLSHLARVDDDDKFPAIFARYFSAIPGPGLITAATAIQGGARIAQAKPHLADRIAAEVLKVARARYRTPECRNVAIGHAIHALGDLLPLLRHPAPVIQFVRRQTRNPRPVTRKKAEHFLKAYPGKAASNRTANRRQHMANGKWQAAKYSAGELLRETLGVHPGCWRCRRAWDGSKAGASSPHSKRFAQFGRGSTTPRLGGEAHRSGLNRSRLDWEPTRRNHRTAMEIKLAAIQIEKPEPVNFILGQTHFIKSVEDIHEALVGTVPGIKFGLAFCEASGKCLVRWTGTDPAMIELAKKNALAIGAGHGFILFLGEGFYPVNVLNAVKMVPEVCRVFCATANSTQVLVAETTQGRGIVGVVDGFPPKGVEGDADIEWRRKFLRQIGYKL